MMGMEEQWRGREEGLGEVCQTVMGMEEQWRGGEEGL